MKDVKLWCGGILNKWRAPEQKDARDENDRGTKECISRWKNNKN